MALADRTFSFRAPADLSERVRRAEQVYAELADDPATAARISRDLEIELQRRLRREAERAPTQGWTLRALTEAFVTAVEAAADEERVAQELRAFDRLDAAGDAERRALQRSSALARDT